MSRADAGRLEVSTCTELSEGKDAVIARCHCAVAHSLCPSSFGGATRLHADALHVEARFGGDAASGEVLSQSQAGTALGEALRYFDGKNLDEMTALGAEGTVHERMARTLWARIVHNLPGRIYDRLDTLDVRVRVSENSSVLFQRRLPGRAQDGSPRASRVTAIVLDLDHLGDDAAGEGARASGLGCGSGDDADVGITPTGIEHCSSFVKLLSAVPHAIFALTSLSVRDVRTHLDAHGLGGIEFAGLLPRATGKEAGDLALWEGSDSMMARLDEPSSILLVSASERVRQDASAARVGPSKRPISVACPTDQGLLAGLGCKRGIAPDPVAYLTAKRPIDAAAYSHDTLRRLEAELTKLRDGGGGELRVLDLGAGPHTCHDDRRPRPRVRARSSGCFFSAWQVPCQCCRWSWASPRARGGHRSRTSQLRAMRGWSTRPRSSCRRREATARTRPQTHTTTRTPRSVLCVLGRAV